MNKIVKNIFDNIKVDKQNEQFFDLINSKNVRIEKIVSNGQKSEDNFWYDQDENEFVIILQGDAILEIQENNEIKEVNLNVGDYLNIPAKQKHRVKYTNEHEITIWLAVFYL
jgi:cupin 2 domain-containing protein